jgi:ribosome biogenesis GTPase
LSEVAKLGWSESWQHERDAMDAAGEPRRVVRHDGVKVLVSDGDAVEHVLFSRATQLAVGDWVLVHNETVTGALPRRTLLTRDHEERGPQVIAANIDVVIVVFGADRPLRRSKVTRFVALAWDIGAQPFVIISKTDIAQDVDDLVRTLNEWLPGVDILTTSIETGEGIEAVAAALAGLTGTFIGESGAGKSSLVNVLMEDEVAWVGEVRETDAKGRHVTSHRELHLLPNGGMIIDNPGVRSLGLTAQGEGVDALYSDIEELTYTCKFSNCGHETEPGCAVLAAVESGDLPMDRWRGYLHFVDEQLDSKQRAHDKDIAAHFRREAAAVREAREERDDSDSGAA